MNKPLSKKPAMWSELDEVRMRRIQRMRKRSVRDRSLFWLRGCDAPSKAELKQMGREFREYHFDCSFANQAWLGAWAIKRGLGFAECIALGEEPAE